MSYIRSIPSSRPSTRLVSPFSYRPPTRRVPAHNSLQCVLQKAVFNRPPPGVRKIVLSTNIAETSVTIDDVVFVIDAGRQREKSYNSALNLQVYFVLGG